MFRDTSWRVFAVNHRLTVHHHVLPNGSINRVSELKIYVPSYASVAVLKIYVPSYASVAVLKIYDGSLQCSPRPRLSKFLSRSESGIHQAVAATATGKTSMRLQRWHGTPVCPPCLKWPAGHGHWGLNWRDLPTQWDRRATRAWKVYNNNDSNNNKSIYIARSLVQRQLMFIDQDCDEPVQ